MQVSQSILESDQFGSISNAYIILSFNSMLRFRRAWLQSLNMCVGIVSFSILFYVAENTKFFQQESFKIYDNFSVSPAGYTSFIFFFKIKFLSFEVSFQSLGNSFKSPNSYLYFYAITSIELNSEKRSKSSLADKLCLSIHCLLFKKHLLKSSSSSKTFFLFFFFLLIFKRLLLMVDSISGTIVCLL